LAGTHFGPSHFADGTKRDEERMIMMKRLIPVATALIALMPAATIAQDRPGGGQGGEHRGGAPGGGGQRPGGGGDHGGRPDGGRPGGGDHQGGPGGRPGGDRPGGPGGGGHNGGPNQGRPGGNGPDHGRPGGNGPGQRPGYRPGGGGHWSPPHQGWVGGRPGGFRRIHASPFRYPHGWGYRRWSVGLLLPSLFLGSQYYYDGWAGLGLYPPPPGDRWVRYGPDLLLVNVRTGRIDDTVYGAFY
jgi:Ni/Co efflux regulator RcnB